MYFGNYYRRDLAGIAAVLKNSNKLFTEQNHFDIRGMAVLQNYQRMGFGKLLVLHCQNFCGIHKVDLIRFIARIESADFCQKMDYQTMGIAFEK